MDVGLAAGYWKSRPPRGAQESLLEAEAEGVESFWTAETYGSDALTPLAWWGASTERISLGTAVCQMAARTPTALAMAALTLDHLNGGRTILGIGASGPQVVEGWYGQPYPRPLERTREYVEIMRAVWSREEPVTYRGMHYELPFSTRDGQGKPLKSIVHPLRSSIPIFLGAEGPKNVALAAEIADGWLPLWFSPKSDEFYRSALEKGFAVRTAGSSREDFQIANTVWLIEHPDAEEAAARLKPTIALYAGGMGSRGANFHNDVFVRMGWADACAEIQHHYLAGRPDQAAKAVPTEMVEDVALVGPAEKICEDIVNRWKSTCLTTMILGGWPGPENRERILEAVKS
ncbi:LLM class F420-dependent oxidoreductase [Rhodococcus sp. 14-2686-1-2]|nr:MULTISPECIES: LLM class F420-dependent oxidoreductase [unclassified Rhodococcus (in: high G+C Gram-positive bacteria)]OZE90751.1 LLM class F420-dependent oxidoreductase [Rhodococcus sp. 15-1189-1-1a]OZF07712.1 LLM class F420-dependent oxidoreductase [Rhodococcus sp. 14-2686-1-2]